VRAIRSAACISRTLVRRFCCAPYVQLLVSDEGLYGDSVARHTFSCLHLTNAGTEILLRAISSAACISRTLVRRFCCATYVQLLVSHERWYGDSLARHTFSCLYLTNAGTEILLRATRSVILILPQSTVEGRTAPVSLKRRRMA
jgi:hypothetical protein